MTVYIRAFIFGRKEPLFTEKVEEVEDKQSVTNCEAIKRHEAELLAQPHMIEIEFPPERPNQPQTFFRFGNEPRLMRIPVPLHLMTSTDRLRYNPQNN